MEHRSPKKVWCVFTEAIAMPLYTYSFALRHGHGFDRRRCRRQGGACCHALGRHGSRASSTAKTRLNAAYGQLRKYGAAPSTYAEELATLEGQLHGEVWPYLGTLKQCMRADLGVDD